MAVVGEVKQKERVVAKSYQRLPSLVPTHKKPGVILAKGKHCSFLGKIKVCGIRKRGHGEQLKTVLEPSVLILVCSDLWYLHSRPRPLVI